jgi:hypothetical protein
MLPVLSSCDEPAAGESRALKTALAQAEARALETRVDPERLATPEGWRAVLRRSFGRHAPRLGGRAYTVETTYTLTSTGTPRAETTEQRTSVVTLNGDARVDHRLAWITPEDRGESGRRCWRVGGRIYSARRTGPASLFDERGGEGDRCLDAAVEPLQTLLLALAPWTQVTVVSSDQAGPDGRETVAVTLTGVIDASATPTALPAFWQPAPRGGADQETMGVPGPRGPLLLSHGVLRSLQGTLTLDAETGLPLTGRLEARFAVQKGGIGGEVTVRSNCTSTADRGPVAPPAEVSPQGPRPRPFLERARLLGESPKVPPAALPKPGDAPPLRVSPGAEGDPPPESDEGAGGAVPPP